MEHVPLSGLECLLELVLTRPQKMDSDKGVLALGVAFGPDDLAPNGLSVTFDIRGDPCGSHGRT